MTKLAEFNPDGYIPPWSPMVACVTDIPIGAFPVSSEYLLNVIIDAALRCHMCAESEGLVVRSDSSLTVSCMAVCYTYGKERHGERHYTIDEALADARHFGKYTPSAFNVRVRVTVAEQTRKPMEFDAIEMRGTQYDSHG